LAETSWAKDRRYTFWQAVKKAEAAL